MTQLSQIEDRALALLSDGHSATVVAQVLGVTDSAISQLASQDEFSRKLQEAKFAKLQAQAARDARLDSLEDVLVQKMEKNIPMLYKFNDSLNAFRVVNQAKRRLNVAPSQQAAVSAVVNLTIPVQIINKFSQNAVGQVLNAAGQSLITIQSSQLERLSQAKAQQESQELENVQIPSPESVQTAQPA